MYLCFNTIIGFVADQPAQDSGPKDVGQNDTREHEDKGIMLVLILMVHLLLLQMQ